METENSAQPETLKCSPATGRSIPENMSEYRDVSGDAQKQVAAASGDQLAADGPGDENSTEAAAAAPASALYSCEMFNRWLSLSPDILLYISVALCLLCAVGSCMEEC